MISLLGLFLIGTDFIRRRSAIGIRDGVLLTMLASVTLLPAVLGFVGRNIDKLRPAPRQAHRQRHGWLLVPLEPRRPAPSRGQRSWSASRSWSCWRSRCFAMRLGFADTGNRPRRATRPAAPTTCSPRASAPASTARCCIATELPDGPADLAVLERPRRHPAGDGRRRGRHAPRSRTRPATRRSCRSSRRRRRRDEATDPPRAPPPRRRRARAPPRHGARRAGRRHHRGVGVDFADFSARGCRCSSAPCWCCRSCC